MSKNASKDEISSKWDTLKRVTAPTVEIDHFRGERGLVERGLVEHWAALKVKIDVFRGEGV